MEGRRDLAKDKPWSASSLYTGGGGCDSPQQECPENRGFFFHTNDENGPWFEIDLGTVQNVSSARIDNRQDCCKERGIPLLIELSTDRKTWKEVARQNKPFDSWKASFSTQRARYFRLRAEGFKILHLHRVRVFP
jgi:hypothetical protein